MPHTEGMIEIITWVLEMAGIAAIVLGAVGATLAAANGRFRQRESTTQLYRQYRQQLSRGILLGLEFLVAADIIDTVAIEPTFTSVGVLGGIVLIRTFLSFTLEVEISGRWPWQEAAAGERE